MAGPLNNCNPQIVLIGTGNVDLALKPRILQLSATGEAAGAHVNYEFSAPDNYMRMVDQRQNQRRLIALEVVAGGSVYCTLLDVSRNGARLTSARRLPDRFYVMLKPGLKRWCQVVWRRRDEVGVKFIPDPQHTMSTIVSLD